MSQSVSFLQVARTKYTSLGGGSFGSASAYRQGFPDLDEAIKLDPSYAPVRRHRGNTIVATYNALRALRRPTNDILDRAIDDLNDAVRLDPTSSQVAVIDTCRPWMGSGRGAQDADNIW